MLKSVAHDNKKSVNMYLNDLIHLAIKATMLGVPIPKALKKSRKGPDPIWDLPKLAKLADPDAPRKYELSEDDKIIYGEK